MGKTVVILRFDEYAAKMREAAILGMDQAANVVANQVRANLSKPGKFKNFNRQASRKDKRFVKEFGFVDPPGGFPRKRSGALGRSVTFDRPSALVRRIGPSRFIKYGRIHELGGVAGNGSYIPARPYLRPALRTSAPLASRAFSLVVRARMRGVRLPMGAKR